MPEHLSTERMTLCATDPSEEGIINRVGDALITFGGDAAVVPSRTGERTSGTPGPAGLHLMPTGDGWTGFPLTSVRAGDWRAWLLGELYGLDGISSADMVRQAVTGSVDVTNLNGHYLLLAHHAGAEEWHVWTNRFGTVHAFLASCQGGAALGTYFPAVAAAASARELDWQGLTGFFGFGFFPQDRTFYRDVKILRPATHHVLDALGKTKTSDRYWTWDYRPNRRRSYDDTLGELAGHLENVMVDHTAGGRVALPISGGLDSRTTVAALMPHVFGSTSGGRPGEAVASEGRAASAHGDRESFGAITMPWSYSYGYSDRSIETRIARRVAEAAGLPFQAFTIPPYLFEKLDDVLEAAAGFTDVTHCRPAAVIGEIGRRANVMVAAHWGDVWFDDMGLLDASDDMKHSSIVDHALQKLEKRGSAFLLEHLCRPHLNGADPKHVLRDLVSSELERLGHIDEPDFRMKAFKTDQWSFRWTLAAMPVFQKGVFPRLTFYDYRLTDFFATVPSDVLEGRRLQVDYLKRFAPNLARITWERHEANLYHYQYANSWLLPKRLFKKAWRMVRPPVQRNWERQFMNPEGRRGLERRLLRGGRPVHDFISHAEISRLVEEFYDHPSPSRGYAVSMLLTFSAWLENFG